MVPHELVRILGVRSIRAADGGSPGIGMESSSGVISLLKIDVKVAGDTGQRAAVADVLDNQLGVVGDTVVGGIGGERFAGNGARHMGPVIVGVPVAVPRQVVINDDLALIAVDGGSRHALAAVPEEGHIDIEPRIAHAYYLAAAGEALGPERG